MISGEKIYDESDAEDIAMDWWMFAINHKLPEGPQRPNYRKWLKRRKANDTWIPVEEALPIVNDNDSIYYEVKFADGTSDEKPFRHRSSKNINGFMSEKQVTHFREISDSVRYDD